MREPARNPREARDRYLRFLQGPLSCISPGVLIPTPRYRGNRDELALTHNPDLLPLKQRAGGHIYFSAGQYFQFIPDDRFEGEWKVRTDGYAYRVTLTDDPSSELISWHWHPDSRPGTHLHVIAAHAQYGAIDKMHIPTGRVALEEVVLFLIEDLDVEPRREDWRDVLASSYERFRTYSTWT